MSMIAAAGEGLDLARLLLDFLIVIAAAKLAAEVAERFGVPAVIGEIAAGVVIGPSVLGLVELGGDRGVSLSLLAEIGVLLLLLQVGMEMDLTELRKVGKESLAVAVLGVALPFAFGTAAALAFGHDAETSVFVGAALTATSVGITARVFGDLRALATTEARVVLGAAVADDVLGLVILTVVVKVVTGGTVTVGTVVGTLGLAVGFLVVAGLVGRFVVPPALEGVQRVASSRATVVVAAFAITLAFAGLADGAQLAFIIGAFMAGLALGQSRQHEAIAADLGAVGNILIPVFFAGIGINADLGAMASPSVLALAGVLVIVGVVTKIVAAVGARHLAVDHLLIGLGMIPRGEVGLIFASIGLATGVLDEELYGALLVVVLVTTVITPPLLRMRLGGAHGAADVEAVAALEPPEGGWVAVVGGEVQLRGRPPVAETVAIALTTVGHLDRAQPSDELLDWFGHHRNDDLDWNSVDTPAFLALLRSHDARAWRFLDVTAVLERTLPEVAAAMKRWRADIRDLDPLGALRFPTVDNLTGADAEAVPDDEMLLAALCADVCDGPTDRACGIRLVTRLGRPDDADSVADLVVDARLLRAATREPDAFDREAVVQFALHMASPARVRQATTLAVALGELPRWHRQALDERVGLLVDVLDHPEAQTSNAVVLAGARLSAAQRLAKSAATAARLRHAPTTSLLANPPSELLRQAALMDPPLIDGEVRVAVRPEAFADRWIIDVACRDVLGVLARLADVLLQTGLDILSASVATWGDGAALDTFVVESPREPDATELRTQMRAALRLPLRRTPMPDLTMRFDNEVLPWYTSCVVSGPDRPGALQAMSAAFAVAGVKIHSARVGSDGGSVSNRFVLSDRVGRKLDGAAMDRVRTALGEDGSNHRLRRFSRRKSQSTASR